MRLLQFIANAYQRRVPAHYGVGSVEPRHDHYRDFKWPRDLCFNEFYAAYCRNGLAAAAIDKTIAKTWETAPALWETEKPAETPIEEDIRRHFGRLRVWQTFANVDRRGMVGAYAGAILILADGKKLSEPVDRVPGGVLGLAGIIPAWEGQIKGIDWDGDPDSPTFSLPRAYQFDQAAVDGAKDAPKTQVRIHPDRVLIWSEDGSLNGQSALEPGYNDLLDAEKVKGAGGEGFWKNSRGTPMFEQNGDTSMADMLSSLGAATPAEALDKINDQVDDWQSGFDKALILGGMTAKPLQITLPIPEHFFNIPVMSFAASMQIPVRILIGNQTGERASTEDAREWAQVCMSRRVNLAVPVLDEFVRRLVAWGVLPAKDWTIGWESLLDATPDQMLDRAAKMADVNAKTLPGDEPAFLPNEIREAAGYEPTPDGDEHGTAEDEQTERDDEPPAPGEPVEEEPVE